MPVEEYQYQITARKMFSDKLHHKSGTVFANSDSEAKLKAKQESGFKPEAGYYSIRVWVAILNTKG